jgi:hypothetical protein
MRIFNSDIWFYDKEININVIQFLEDLLKIRNFLHINVIQFLEEYCTLSSLLQELPERFWIRWIPLIFLIICTSM